MTAKEMAMRLNGREYLEEITRDEENLAKENELVVVFGYSDDNTEVYGAIREEVGTYNGGMIYLTKDGVFEPECGESDCPYYKAAIKDSKTIEAVWGDEKVGASWSYKTDIPHETFNIYEDGELFCVGIIFSLEDL